MIELRPGRHQDGQPQELVLSRGIEESVSDGRGIYDEQAAAGGSARRRSTSVSKLVK